MKSDVVPGLESAAWPVLVLDKAGGIRRANPSALELFGTDLATSQKSIFDLWQADNETPVRQFLARCEQAPPVLLPVRLRAAGGMGVSFQASVAPWTLETETLFIVQLHPGSSEQRAPSTEASNSVKQKLDCALQLSRTVALDFNNALTSIMGHTSLVLSKLEPGSPWRASLAEVEKSAAKAAEIANDLANFSRQEKENRAQHTGNLNLLLQRGAETLQAVPREKQISWSLQFERRLYAAKFDEAKMQQAFGKILDNAIEALGPQGRIVIQTKNIDLTEPTQDRNARLVAGAYVCAEFSDSGAGIEPEVLPRVFEPFFTTKRSGQHRGLGLAWVYGIVTNHGGGVAISSQVGVGTSVRVYLPADKKIVRDHSVNPDDLNGSQTILMVDDEDPLLTLGQTILSSYGYRVLVANNGQKALEMLAQPETPIDLLITDLVMPGMSGRELVGHVQRVSPHTRVLCSSGYVRPNAQEEEHTVYIQKPFTSQELLVKVKQALSGTDAMPVD